MTDKNARTHAKHLVKKYTDVNGELIIGLENVGISVNSLAKKIADLTNAKKKLIRKKVKVKTDTGEIESYEYMDVDDNLAQVKGVEIALDIFPGARAPKKTEVTVNSFEAKASITADLAENPKIVMEIVQKMLERKKIETTGE